MTSSTAIAQSAAPAQRAGPVVVTATLLAAGGALAALAVYAFLLWRQSDLALVQRFAESSGIVTGVALAGLAVLIVWKGRSVRGNRALALTFALVALTGGLGESYDFLKEAAPLGLRIAVHIGATLAYVTYLRAAQLFPNPLTADEVSSANAPWKRAPWLRWLLRVQLDRRVLWLVWGVGLALTFPAPEAAVIPLQVIALSLGIAYWRAHWRVGTALERRQIGWIVQAALAYLLFYLAAIGLNALFAAPGLQSVRPYVAVVFNFLGTGVIVGCLFMAVFRAGAVSPELIIRRTVVYGAAVALLLAALNLIQSLLVETAADAMGVDDNLVSAVLGTAAGLAFQPLAERLKLFFDRFAPKEGTGEDGGGGAISAP